MFKSIIPLIRNSRSSRIWPIAYSVTGKRKGRQDINIRFVEEEIEKLGWSQGDIIDIQTDPDQPNIVMIEKSTNGRGRKLYYHSGNRKFLALRLPYKDKLGFPYVSMQVGCEVLERIDGGMYFRIRTEDDIVESKVVFKNKGSYNQARKQ